MYMNWFIFGCPKMDTTGKTMVISGKIGWLSALNSENTVSVLFFWPVSDPPEFSPATGSGLPFYCED